MAETKTTKKVAEEKATKTTKTATTKTAAKTTTKKTTTKTTTAKATTAKKAVEPKNTEVVTEVKNAPKKATKKESSKKIRVTLIRSAIACKPNQVKTVKALGLNKVNSHNDLVDNDAVRGMIFTVKHLVKVEEI